MLKAYLSIQAVYSYDRALPPKLLLHKQLLRVIISKSNIHCLLVSHLVPDHPGSQSHAPFAAEHVPLSLQSHVLAHSSPHRPCGQTVEHRHNHAILIVTYVGCVIEGQTPHTVCSIIYT